MTSPTYHLAKTINKIISPFIPAKFTIKSTNDFIDLLQSHEFIGNIASLDVESLFTNVPIDDTINIIINLAYNHPIIAPPKIPSNLLRELLEMCTKESPFVTPDGRIFKQIDGVAMGSPLGPTFANFYMGYLEETTFSDINKKPLIYARYVDDIFIMYSTIEQLKEIKRNFENNSILKFTIEESAENKLPFLDVLIGKEKDKFHTKVYRKNTNLGQCLNAQSECTDRYKESVIKNYIKRAYKTSSTWKDFDTELNIIKQILVNNNYKNNMIDYQINIFINKINQTKMKESNKNNILVYYKNQMNGNYKKDEKILKDIINRNVKCVQSDNKLKIIIYYKNNKTSNLVIKNNTMPKPTPLETANVVYKFTCNIQHCKAEYVGHTRLSLEKRLQAHSYNGSIKNHYKESHNSNITKEILRENTTIITKEQQPKNLAIKEALFILKLAPRVNVQFQTFNKTLQLFQLRNSHCTNNLHLSVHSPVVSHPE